MRIYKRPFFDRTCHLPYFLRLIINLPVVLFLRVLYPFVGLPHGVQGCLPPEVLPSPPPCGCSTGFIATPLTCGLLPSHLDLPALPIETLKCSMLPTCPNVAIHLACTIRISLPGPELSISPTFNPSGQMIYLFSPSAY